MTREETKKCIEVMQAYVDGKEIEVLYPEQNGEWTWASSPIWDFDKCNYRIKEEPKPFDWRGKNIQWVRMTSGFPNGIFRVMEIHDNGISHSGGFCGWPLIKNLEWSSDNATWRKFELLKQIKSSEMIHTVLEERIDKLIQKIEGEK